ncbi:hypothetical protein QCA50_013963 [Cerrena zonata]|uniref:tRNA 4-demethylwyosine synthase (AdoMet-dependent) n=1 Tax=Cerrena zonata TaxID=2478898 RepID=A0AAW0G1K1_9APHY
MASGLYLLVLCIAVYLVSGGRFSIALAGAAAYYLHQHSVESKKASQINASKEIGIKTEPDLEPKFKSKSNSKAKESPIYAVDFTSTTFTPSETSNIPANPTPTKSKTISSLRSRAKRTPKVFKASKPVKKTSTEPVLTKTTVDLLESQIYIFYTSLTGTSQRIAKSLNEKLNNLYNLKNPPKLLSLDDDVDDLEEYFLKTPKQNGDTKNIYVMVLPSYEIDSPIDYFLDHLTETYNDFRVDKYPLKSLLGFAVLGLGDSESWPEKFCYQARLADKWLGKLGGRRLYPLGEVCMKYEGEPVANEWIQNFAGLLNDNEPFYLDDDDFEDSDKEEEESDSTDGDGETLVDVEDMGDIMKKQGTDGLKSEAKEMVSKNSPTYKSLTKQGYSIIGSHSGVKICRWTKSALRGRDVIVQGALQAHYQKIKQMRGVPGIQMDRFEEAFKVKHAALSLVGEPISYLEISSLIKNELHSRGISSFLVCNAQHPDNLRSLCKVTQLYVSIDAPTKTDLKKIDRPLNSDFWERLMECLDILRTVQSHQRTVFRLTLVKGFNMDEIKGYADMVIRAQPSQIEVKGATFCGSSTGNGNPLTMQNIPFYEECRKFVINLSEELKSRGYDYEVAAEHAHSCCILIAHTKFKINNKWHTHIDYPRFFELVESGEEFTDMDYIKETPEWAVWGSKEAGFNPLDVKFDRKAEKLKKKKEREEQARIALEKQQITQES